MKDNTKVFEEYTVPKAVMTMALPSMLSMLINIVYNLADTFFVGQTGDSNQVAAVSVSMPLFLLFIATGNLFGVGGCAFISRSLGEGRKDRVKTISAFCIYASIAVGLVLGIIFFTLKNQILMLVGASENTLGLAADYLKWVALGAPSIVLAITASNLVRGEGAAKESMIGSVIGQITNIILDPIFILHTGDKLFGINMPFGFDMGVAGAAIATVLSRYVEAAIVIGWTHRHTEKNAFAKGLYSTLKVPANLTKKILVKGTPLLFNETLWASAMAMLTQCYSIRGLNVVASLNISNTINNVFNIVFIALGDSVAIIVGQLLGAGDMKKARDTDNKMIAFSVMCCTCVAMVMFVMAPLFPMLYNTNDEARELAKYLIMITAFFMPQNAFLHATYFTLRSGGKTIITFLFDSVFIWCVSVPIAFVLSRYTGIHVLVIYACVQLADLIKCVIGFVLVKKGVWLQNIVSS